MVSIRVLDKSPSKAFYGDRISNNMTVTPEGFLICHNVAISRVGKQEYLGKEIGLQGHEDEHISVIREESEVFNTEAIASFEGKPVTDDHPGMDVDSDNYKSYLKGHSTNVRQGAGADKDKLIADLVIYDNRLIGEIQRGKREISCGYDCLYEVDEEGKVYQTNIRGNHIAVVDRGRAGHKVRIKDEKPKQGRSIKFMRKPSIITRILGLAKDADPAEVAEIIETVQELQEAVEETEVKTPDSKPSESATDNSQQSAQDDEVMGNMLEILKSIEEKLATLGTKQEDSPLQKLEDELSNEEEVSKPAKEIDEEVTNDNELEEDEELEETQASDEDEPPVKNNDSLLALVRAMKPIIADIPDSTRRRKAEDALTSAIRQQKGKPKKPLTNGYKTILDTKINHAKKQVQDTANTANTYDTQQNVYDKLNPHKSGGNQ